ncbi:High-affinity nickel transport protein (fragment) [Paraburkholderia ribeironis]|uniref:Nickel/cobalt efflux system n=1 Tax=Paraburkholderia ribeironis TaxID=1247936 RepID=A0A1N7S334_9BURK
MTLVDSTDNVLMVHAYGWAMDDPKRKFYYNASITLVSAVVAVVVGGVEALGLLSDRLGLSGGVWDAVASLNERFGAIGYGIVAAFMACWIGSLLSHRWRRPGIAAR